MHGMNNMKCVVLPFWHTVYEFITKMCLRWKNIVIETQISHKSIKLFIHVHCVAYCWVLKDWKMFKIKVLGADKFWFS